MFKHLNIYSRLKFIVFIGGAVFLIPFVFSFSTIDPVLSIRFVAWTVVNLILILIFLFQSLRLHLSPDSAVIYRVIFPVFLGIIIIAGFSLIQTINLAEGIFEWFKILLSFTFFYVACITLTQNKENISYLNRSVIIMALMLSFIGICQYLQIAFTSIPGNYGVYATMANTNLFASALFLTLPFILFGAIQYLRIWYSFSLVSLMGVIYAIAISETRAVWGAVFVATAFTICVVLFGYRKLKLSQNEKYFYRRRSLIIIVIFLFSIVVAIGSHSNKNNHLCLFSKRSTPANSTNSKTMLNSVKPISSFQGRLKLWQTSISMIKSAPLLGIGLGQWKIAAPAYEGNSKIRISGKGLCQTWVQRPHNDFLWVFAETGIFGFLAHILFWNVLIFYSLRTIKSTNDFHKKIFAILLLFGVIGFAVISCVSFPKERIFHNILFVLISGCIVSCYHQTYPIRKSVKPQKLLYFNMFLLLVLIFSLVFAYMRFGAEMYTKNALQAYKYKKWQKVISEIDKTDFSFYNLDPTSTPIFWYRGMAQYKLGKIDEAGKDFEKAYTNNPYNVHVINNLGTYYALNQDYDKAKNYFQKALSISPQFKEARSNLDLVYSKTKILK